MPFVTSSDALVLDSSFLVARGIPWLSCLVVEHVRSLCHPILQPWKLFSLQELLCLPDLRWIPWIGLQIKLVWHFRRIQGRLEERLQLQNWINGNFCFVLSVVGFAKVFQQSSPRWLLTSCNPLVFMWSLLNPFGISSTAGTTVDWFMMYV